MSDLNDTNYEEDELLIGIKEHGLYFEEDLSSIEIKDDIIRLIPKDLASQYHLVPVRYDEMERLVVVSDIADSLKHIAAIQRRIKKSVRILISSEENVKQALRQYYDITSYRQIIRTSARGEDSTEDSNLTRKVKQLIDWAIIQRASDLHLIPYSNGIFVRIRVNGFLQDVSGDWDFQPSDGPLVVNIIKQMDTSGNASHEKSNLPNSGHFVVMQGDNPVECRLQTNPLGDASDDRQHVNLRFLPQMKEIKELSAIYTGKDLQSIVDVLYKGGAGMYLLSGPVGTGKSTSIQAMQEYLRQLYVEQGREINIFEIQNPIEYVDERNIQVEERLAKDEELSFDAMKALKSALRSDPDIITYGEIRDSLDAQVATRACQTGLRMFSTVHAGDCIRTINRLLDLDVSRMSLLAELKIIVCQRLIGVLCPKCSNIHEITAQERSILTDKEYSMLMKHPERLRERGPLISRKTCNCQDGLLGRVAIPEFIIFTDELRNQLLHMDSFDMVPRVLRKNGFKSMWDKGLEMVQTGDVELSDVIQKIGRD